MNPQIITQIGLILLGLIAPIFQVLNPDKNILLVVCSLLLILFIITEESAKKKGSSNSLKSIYNDLMSPTNDDPLLKEWKPITYLFTIISMFFLLIVLVIDTSFTTKIMSLSIILLYSAQFIDVYTAYKDSDGYKKKQSRILENKLNRIQIGDPNFDPSEPFNVHANMVVAMIKNMLYHHGSKDFNEYNLEAYLFEQVFPKNKGITIENNNRLTLSYTTLLDIFIHTFNIDQYTFKKGSKNKQLIKKKLELKKNLASLKKKLKEKENSLQPEEMYEDEEYIELNDEVCEAEYELECLNSGCLFDGEEDEIIYNFRINKVDLESKL